MFNAPFCEYTCNELTVYNKVLDSGEIIFTPLRIERQEAKKKTMLKPYIRINLRLL